MPSPDRIHCQCFCDHKSNRRLIRDNYCQFTSQNYAHATCVQIGPSWGAIPRIGSTMTSYLSVNKNEQRRLPEKALVHYEYFYCCAPQLKGAPPRGCRDKSERAVLAAV